MLDKLLNSAVDSKSIFDHHQQKILNVLNMLVEEMKPYNPTSEEHVVSTVFSQNACLKDEMDEIGKKQYNLLLDVSDLCVIYYQKCACKSELLGVKNIALVIEKT